MSNISHSIFQVGAFSNRVVLELLDVRHRLHVFFLGGFGCFGRSDGLLRVRHYELAELVIARQLVDKVLQVFVIGIGAQNYDVELLAHLIAINVAFIVYVLVLFHQLHVVFLFPPHFVVKYLSSRENVVTSPHIPVWLDLVAVDHEVITSAHAKHYSLPKVFKSFFLCHGSKLGRNHMFVEVPHRGFVIEVDMGLVGLITDEAVLAEPLRPFNALIQNG